ncbi:type II secretion system F family protein [Marinivivus vitaminiproducens]|uniref:type II secretion system F family protein n=1 Tax=Marinivivus vitaminiproducens TaxID=3035935 RepID=UPI00279A746F|nr:type II secretion system F family protein [Geminicoccaceae bacterium SCSIO 64248]
MTPIPPGLLVLLAGGGAGLFVLLLGLSLGGSAGRNDAVARRLRRIANRRAQETPEERMAALLRRPSAASSGWLARLVPDQRRLSHRLHRAGIRMSLTAYAACTAVFGVLLALVFWRWLGLPPLAAPLAAFALAVGGPHILAGRLEKRRQATFLATFPEAIDLILRGLKAGLPVSASLDTVGNEVGGPVGQEFKRVVADMAIGGPMEQALEAAAERIGVREFRFFAVSLVVQQETGGDLAETLANLSDILRKRRTLKLKVRALSSEARASATIIGVLPFLMFALISLMNPDYAGMLTADDRGRVLAMIGFGWLVAGFIVMRHMVRLEP